MVGFPVIKAKDGLTVKQAVLVDEKTQVKVLILPVDQLNLCVPLKVFVLRKARNQ